MRKRPLIIGLLMLMSSGCSVITQERIDHLDSADAGPDTRDGCRTTQDCLNVTGREVDCHVQCVRSTIDERGHCERNIDVDTPDGVFCGNGDEDQICVGGSCVDRGCGDGFIDRRGPNPEYCDDAVEREACVGCVRTCQIPAGRVCDIGREDEDGPCWGGAGMCNDVSCVPVAPLDDGTECALTSGSSGICEAGVCVERLP